MKTNWWWIGGVAAVVAGVGVARWWAPNVVLIPAAAAPSAETPRQPLRAAPPVQAAAATLAGV